jgi:hypothetical protein
MFQRKKMRRPVDHLQGTGSVYIEDACIADVEYDLDVVQEFVSVKNVSPPQELKGPKMVSGKLVTVGGGVIPMLKTVLVLELQDQRKLDFYVSRSIPHAYAYQYEIKGSGGLRKTS